MNAITAYTGTASDEESYELTKPVTSIEIFIVLSAPALYIHGGTLHKSISVLTDFDLNSHLETWEHYVIYHPSIS